MSRDTQVIVRVPAEFNESLAKYKKILEEKGVIKSKADVIIYLALIGYMHERSQDMDMRYDSFDMSEGRSG